MNAAVFDSLHKQLTRLSDTSAMILKLRQEADTLAGEYYVKHMRDITGLQGELEFALSILTPVVSAMDMKIVSTDTALGRVYRLEPVFRIMITSDLMFDLEDAGYDVFDYFGVDSIDIKNDKLGLIQRMSRLHNPPDNVLPWTIYEIYPEEAGVLVNSLEEYELLKNKRGA